MDENILGGGEEEVRRKEMKIYSMRDHSNNFKLAGTPAGQPAKTLGICKNISIQRGRRAAEVFSDSLAGIIINDVRGVVRRKS